MKKPQIIIPMSGIGKRFVDAGYNAPKPFITVDGLPIIEHVLNLFDRPSDCIFICNEQHMKHYEYRKILKDISPGCKIYEVSNENRKGPVDAISKIFDYIDDDRDVIVSYCDYGTQWNYEDFLINIYEKKIDGSIPCYTGFHPHMLGNDDYAYCKIDNDYVCEVREKKPFTNNKMNEYASNGTYYFKSGKILKKYFKELINKNIHINGEFYVSLVYNLMIEDNLKVNIYEIKKMLQWGTPYDLEVYNKWSNFFRFKKDNLSIIDCPKNTTLILPMAGKGSRFTELDYKLPKPLLPLNNNIMVVEAVNCLPKTDKKIFICLNEHYEKYNFKKIISEFYENVSIVNLSEVSEGQAITCEIGIYKENINLDDPILISACDNGIYYNSENIKKLFDDSDIDIIVWSFRNSQSSVVSPDSYAWLDIDDDNCVKYVSCKKFIFDNPLNHHAIVGTIFFRKAKYFIDGLKKNKLENIKTNNEFYVDDVLNQNIKSGLKIKVFEVEDYICWGTPNDFKTYNYWREYFEIDNKN
jgi:NDP-sugar pyrophosphorylase family protein